MKQAEFSRILKSRQAHIRETLLTKATEYARNNDRLHNFKRAAAMNDETPAQALWGMLSKHIVSIKDMVDATADGIYPSEDQINEKIGDANNYLHLLEATFIEGLEQ